MAGALIIPLCLPFYTTSTIRSGVFRPYYKVVYWFFIGIFFILGWIGAKPVEYPFITIGQIATTFYFLILLVIIPLLEQVENRLYILNLKN
jgi:ubiquinol-cytochrome c reductase cytochrome b subunit